MLEQNVQTEKIYVEGNSNKSALIGIFLLLVVVVGYVFFTRGLSSKVNQMNVDITSKNLQIESSKAKIAEMTAAEEELDLSSEVKKTELLKSVPKDVDQDQIIRDIIDTAKVHDITLNSIGFGKGASSKEGVGSLRINASFEGNYNDLVSFLESVEQNARVLIVDSINVQLGKTDLLDATRATFSLSMQAFYLKK
ncbi:type II secretion system protein M [Candidatus Gracilibacteria bacterium]|jgi:Tfp pilus assembly protein PilO|nr:type II secretion system protein M [Candidatus Gracilibacteria bacterium]